MINFLLDIFPWFSAFIRSSNFSLCDWNFFQCIFIVLMGVVRFDFKIREWISFVYYILSCSKAKVVCFFHHLLFFLYKFQNDSAFESVYLQLIFSNLSFVAKMSIIYNIFFLSTYWSEVDQSIVTKAIFCFELERLMIWLFISFHVTFISHVCFLFVHVSCPSDIFYQAEISLILNLTFTENKQHKKRNGKKETRKI